MVMTVNVQILGLEFVLLNGGPDFKMDEAISFQVNCESQDEVDYYWAKLAEGGEHGPCGWLKDRFGVSWQIIPTVLDQLIADPNPARAQAAMKAMLNMSKLDVAELQRAADAA
jgi:predicted 3-demethylubiquinone-9 3-methyltransferase (glyoxalase superfamily)